MIWKNSILVAVIGMLLVSCGGSGDTPKTEGESTVELTAEASFERIKAMEDSVYNQKSFDPRGVQSLHDVYGVFLKRFPNDTLTPHVLFRAASTGRQLGRGQESINQYDRIIKDYPQWYRVPDAAYMKAFTLDDQLGQKGEAEVAYKEVIANYPDHHFARDAQAMLDNLHLTDEELIKKFEEMNKQNAN
jgi:outer membrane protein assembly factor BamD (BamD/ComL family)